MGDSFDYVVVGSGSAGCVLADRLTEAGDATVCVLEAGIADRHPLIRVPVGFVKTLYNPAFTWPFVAEANPALGGRKVGLPQGRIVGGSTSVNGLAYSRGQAADFDDWASAGNVGWGYEDVLPYFKRSERWIGPGDDAYRGRHGGLPVSSPDWPSALCEAFIAGASEAGVPRNDDYNGVVQEGAGYFQRIIERGRRVSAADAFLHPAVRRGRVDLRIAAQAVAILFDGRRATGIRYRQGGAERTVSARREVLLCGGTLNSPKLLQLSGIGPGALLAGHGIAVRHELPGVGENLRDHFTVRIAARARDTATINERSRGWRLGVEIARWLAGRPSIIGLSPSLVHVFWKSRAELNRGDIQVLFTPASYQEGKTYVLDDFPGMSCGARQQRPESKGYVRITSADPADTPAVQPNYLAEEADQRVLVAALKLARTLLNTAAMAPSLVGETLPGPDVSTDAEWLDYARRRGGTAYHLVGTCRMAPTTDPTAVVDAELRVHGLEGLRVADASIMPQVPSANTMAASLMIGEKAANLVLGRPALPRVERRVA